MTQIGSSWTATHSIETTATPEAVFRLFEDVAGWKAWNEGIELVELEGPFEGGTWFTMKPPGQDALRCRLVEVKKNLGFVDETAVGDLVVRVAHRIERGDAGRTRITYSIEAVGEGAADVGPAIASDFPDVLAALAKRAEGNGPLVSRGNPA